MEPKNDIQRSVAEFVNVTVKQAFDDVAKAVNTDAVISAEVQPKMPPKGLGRVTLSVRAPRHSDSKMVSIFVIVVDASPYFDSARVYFEAGPMMVDGKLMNSHKGDLEIPGVFVTTDATVRQVRDYVRALVDDAIEGYRVRQAALRPRS